MIVTATPRHRRPLAAAPRRPQTSLTNPSGCGISAPAARNTQVSRRYQFGKFYNLILLCRRHHTLLHRSQWEIYMINGLPHFKPPKWVDPEQKLRRNLLRQ
jgi:hypothetical protein